MDGRRGPRRYDPPSTRILGFELPDPTKDEASSSAAVPGTQLPNAAAPRQVSLPVNVPAPQPPPEVKLDGFGMAHMEHGNALGYRPLPHLFPHEVEPLPSISAKLRGEGAAGDDAAETGSGMSSQITTTLQMSLDEEQSAPSTPGAHAGRARPVYKDQTAKSPITSPRPPLAPKQGFTSVYAGILTSIGTSHLNRQGNVRAGPPAAAVAKADGGAEGGEASGKAKPATRAERRALQEAQRAAKAAAKGGGKDGAGTSGHPGPSDGAGKGGKKDVEKVAGKEKEKDGGKGADKKKEVPAVRLQFDNEKKVEKVFGKTAVEQMVSKNRVELFRHLPQFEHRALMASTEAKFAKEDLHPAVYQLGLKYLSGDITGANARCVAMLLALKHLVADYTTPPERMLPRDLTGRINTNVHFLSICRPLATSMGNGIKYLKLRIADLGKPDAQKMTEAEAKARIVEQIERYIQDKIVIAGQAIVKHALTKIKDGNVILTYGCSNVVELILKAAHTAKTNFRVVVVDSRPKLEGQELVRRLLQAGIACTYVQISALCYIMKEVSLAMLGAASVLANGTVVSRCGTAAVGMVAHQFQVPVLVCCESYKFHERVQLDSICSNELGDPEALVYAPGRKPASDLEGWEEIEKLQLLNLLYDAMPAEFVDAIITELGMFPPTSVPVVLREHRKETII